MESNGVQRDLADSGRPIVRRLLNTVPDELLALLAEIENEESEKSSEEEK